MPWSHQQTKKENIKETSELSYTIEKTDLTDICEMFCPNSV
jgi:hypothetical protein